MLQLEMIERFREVCAEDERVMGALMFGSFAAGEGDAFSDIEFAVFISDDVFDEFQQSAWLEEVNPVVAYFEDDFGHRTALFENGVRGEFHFMRYSEVSVVEGWLGYGWFPSLEDALILDRKGDLSRHASVLVGGPPARGGAALVQGLGLNLLNLMLFGANLLNRGEFARAWALLTKSHESLLKLIRLSEGATDHWPTPSRAFEKDLSAGVNERYLACTSGARPNELCAAYRESWKWGRELFDAVGGPLKAELPSSIVEKVDDLLVQASTRWPT